jgi:hypothetical protein
MFPVRRRGLKRAGLYVMLGLFGVGDAFLIAACSNTCCKQVNTQVYLNGSGIPTNCYQYTNRNTSCWGCCGKGSAQQGYCTTTNCDPDQVCSGTDTTYQYQKGIATTADCAIASAYNEYDIGCQNLGTTKYNEMLCTCGPPVSGAKTCQ